MNRRILLLIIAIVIIIVAVFPTPHVRTNSEITETIDLNTTLADGQIMQEIWTDMPDQTKIIVFLSSNTEVQVLLTGSNGVENTYYNLTQTTHGVEYTREYSTYNVTVWNPTGIGDGSSAELSGNIQAYHIYDMTEWLPWWMS